MAKPSHPEGGRSVTNLEGVGSNRVENIEPECNQVRVYKADIGSISNNCSDCDDIDRSDERKDGERKATEAEKQKFPW